MKFRRSLIFFATLFLVLAVGNAANDYYYHSSGAPSSGSQASSATMRAEFDSIGTGFDKLPTLTGNADETVVINAGATGMTSKTAAEMRTFIGLGTMATQNANAVAITGGSVAGITDLAVADGGTGASTAANARTNLGLGTIATQSAASVAITGGSITGITDLAVADGGTGASTAANARTNLGAAASGANTDITGLTGITGSITSTKACVAGYTRTGPNYCARDGYSTGFTTLTAASGCTATTSIGTSDAKAIAVLAAGLSVSENAIGERAAQANTYVGSDTTCVTETGVLGGSAREEIATAGSAYLGKTLTFHIVRSTTAGVIYVKPATISTNSSVVFYTVGYFD